MNNRLQIHLVITSWGNITVETKEQCVVRCSLPFSEDVPEVPFKIETLDDAPSVHYLSKLFAGQDAPLPPVELPKGTSFQRSVWQGIQSIPWGKTLSYAALAQHIGAPRAVRALANACGKNPLPLFIPCHRVIDSNGTLGGFSSGVAWKKLLLNCEGCAFY